ncbi:hypothetical protein [Embleya hyalina]|uniref:hypothetical protein n=1 Tax=Embleya hyalina TaxID=516124 RepID=UPI000F839FEB|nr:hypothetical protein [Embleya hyalina]
MPSWGGALLGVASLGLTPGALAFALVAFPFGVLAALVLPSLLVLAPGSVWRRKWLFRGFFVGMGASTGAALWLLLATSGVVTEENRLLGPYLVLWSTCFAALVAPIVGWHPRPSDADPVRCPT